jgi:hypothetical protein
VGIDRWHYPPTGAGSLCASTIETCAFAVSRLEIKGHGKGVWMPSHSGGFSACSCQSLPSV